MVKNHQYDIMQLMSNKKSKHKLFYMMQQKSLNSMVLFLPPNSFSSLR